MSNPSIAPLAVTFRRLTTNPLEDNRTFTTLAAAQTYAASATAYVGQLISVVTNDNAPINIYQIQKDKSLKLIETSGGDECEELDAQTVNNILTEEGF